MPVDSARTMNRLVIPSILAATVLIAGIFVFQLIPKLI